uniref:Uncharacterized protein n=1 Tax=Picea glauca TaxID=3330 RepID=A0A101LVQ3_PICGL|nr:hypothetical protein ABT39_MTgene2007 [Picea glauca]QHR87372.1 hypothetical protein Q903MT_gene1382 [Picea sitchensis]
MGIVALLHHFRMYVLISIIPYPTIFSISIGRRGLVLTLEGKVQLDIYIYIGFFRMPAWSTLTLNDVGQASIR